MAVWIDNTRVMLLDEAQVGDNMGTLSVYSLDSAERMEIGQGGTQMLSDGLGSVAVSDGTRPLFAVWRDGHWSDAIAGYPVAWSLDGSKLGLLHLVDFEVAGPGTNGYLEIIEWPSRRTVWRDADEQFMTSSTFIKLDPTGRFVGLLSMRYRVLDLDYGTVADVATKNFWNDFGWDADSHIVIGDSRANTISAYDALGERVETWRGLGDTATSTPTGFSLLFYTTDYPDDPPPFSIVSDGDVRSFSTEGSSGSPLAFSPDGDEVVLQIFDENKPYLIAGP